MLVEEMGLFWGYPLILGFQTNLDADGHLHTVVLRTSLLSAGRIFRSNFCVLENQNPSSCIIDPKDISDWFVSGRVQLLLAISPQIPLLPRSSSVKNQLSYYA